jgi:hypothetical protein
MEFEQTQSMMMVVMTGAKEESFISRQPYV